MEISPVVAQLSRLSLRMDRSVVRSAQGRRCQSLSRGHFHPAIGYRFVLSRVCWSDRLLTFLCRQCFAGPQRYCSEDCRLGEMTPNGLTNRWSQPPAAVLSTFDL